ncbi:single-stranded-DNA-specific exonuclease RecJ [Candidatus Curtissbacteria bacterium RIFCSPHIGHO2_01_FULL_41_11]|uniref:Single-stranded-DNA-specific exonuclease RecJ n=1 Tax=Candidatus Curtissbacteria bacterium RIFCSPHIGHO2_01_FULL_41_11 TaxID=1797711 RepID=A0A1F5G4Z1_9BACT|nr:MAG: single-stranded-DNA-specific exonuclease RecJ [Candidatus Curtissbacteria bacterium RIFCSPHIGHO2_01_FULL_41_11]
MTRAYEWKIRAKAPDKKSPKWLLEILAKNRGLDTKKKLNEFLNPTLEIILNVKLSQIEKGRQRIVTAIKKNQNIAIYCDYDADGLCAAAIMWETLHDLGAKVMPYVPHRITEGYGLSKQGILKLKKEQNIDLIITVDQGVTAVEQVRYAKELGIDIVITDHHVLPKNQPQPTALVHSTELCGAGVSWRLAWEIVESQKPSYKDQLLEKLELAALATVADLVPLIGANRAIVKLGLEQIAKTKRPGIKALIRASNITWPVTTHEIGHIIAPRINAMGRIEHGLDSLRLLCARSQNKADSLAQILSKTNTRRQDLTTKAINHARSLVEEEVLIGVVQHDTWHEGVIGLVASRLVESFYRPMIVISRGKKFSKGSARSIPGFNIIEAIRASSQYLVDAGGHPMAAGFTIETQHIEVFKDSINKYARKIITEEILARRLEIECELETDDINMENLKTAEIFEPFGVANPQPLFMTKNMTVKDVRGVGPESIHLKLYIDSINAIGFHLGEFRSQIRPGYKIDLVYTIAEDRYAANGTIQLKVKDLRINHLGNHS